jgi:hypothetical protein
VNVRAVTDHTSQIVSRGSRNFRGVRVRIGRPWVNTALPANAGRVGAELALHRAIQTAQCLWLSFYFQPKAEKPFTNLTSPQHQSAPHPRPKSARCLRGAR